jgi:pimeloyl-ACP methyl ester carboxylesterase
VREGAGDGAADMSGGASWTRRRVISLAAAGVSAAAAAAWAAQHRAAARAVAGSEAFAEEGLTLPDYVMQHDVDADDGGRLHVIERGSGPAIVLLHGFMLSSELWAHQLRDLGGSHRVVAPDLRGHGHSVPGTSGFAADAAAAHEGPLDTVRTDAAMALAQRGSPAIRRMAADLDTVLRALDIEHALLVGHSMGGMVALQYMCDTPKAERARRVTAVALVSTTAGPFSRMPGFGGMARLAGPVSSRAIHLGERWGVRAASGDVRFWLTRLGFGPDAPARQVRFVERLHAATPADTVRALLPSLALFDVSGSLSEIDLPVLVVVGSHDHLTPPRHALRTADALAHAQLVELPRCGHMPMLERRREFARLLDEFAAKLG